VAARTYAATGAVDIAAIELEATAELDDEDAGTADGEAASDHVLVAGATEVFGSTTAIVRGGAAATVEALVEFWALDEGSKSGEGTRS